jgi:hypothetical protein
MFTEHFLGAQPCTELPKASALLPTYEGRIINLDGTTPVRFLKPDRYSKVGSVIARHEAISNTVYKADFEIAALRLAMTSRSTTNVV